jgi:hypothetical protein
MRATPGDRKTHGLSGCPGRSRPCPSLYAQHLCAASMRIAHAHSLMRIAHARSPMCRTHAPSHADMRSAWTKRMTFQPRSPTASCCGHGRHRKAHAVQMAQATSSGRPRRGSGRRPGATQASIEATWTRRQRLHPLSCYSGCETAGGSGIRIRLGLGLRGK